MNGNGWGASGTGPVAHRAGRFVQRTGILVLLLGLVGAGIIVAPARAASSITITSQPAVQDHFPSELDFTVSAKDSVPITQVVLHYSLEPGGDSVLANASFSKGTSVQAQYRMLSNGNPLYLPPGKDISYYWEIDDQSGGALKTQPATTSFTDTRFPWQTVTSGNLTLYYYRGSSSDAKSLLAVGRTAIDKAAKLEGVTFTIPVKAYAYASSSDFLPAAQKESQATDPGLLGQAEGPNIVLFWSSSLTSSDVADTLRHELTHLVTGAAVQGGFADLLPLWLNEGISVYAQSNPGGFGQAIQQAVDNDTVVPIQVLESARGVDVGLFYGESWALVKYMIDSGGQAKFAQLLAAFKNGKSTDQALQATYGFDRTGLYNAWRQSVGLTSSAAAATPGQSAAPQQQATAPGSAGQPQTNATAFTGPPPSRGSNQTASSPDSGTMILLITVGGALMLMLLAAVIAFGLLLAQRRSSG